MVNTKQPSEIWTSSLDETHLGTILCGMTRNGLAFLTFGEDPVFEDLSPSTSSPIPEEIEQKLQDVIHQVQSYLDGTLKDFDVPLDLSGCTEFQKKVLMEVIKIPYGQVVTYGHIAERLGGMKLVRAVGGAVGANPIPIIIPCHRVVSTNGHLRGYSGWGGIRTKAWLLKLEGQLLIAGNEF